MARIRTVKPEFFKHYDLFRAEVEAGLPVRLAFEALWCQADREGRFKWEPYQLKTDCLPYDEVDFARVLDVLATRGFIVRYEVDGKNYGHIPTFGAHQQINNRESKSVLPPPPKTPSGNKEKTARETHVTLASPTRQPRDTETLEGKGREGNGKEDPPTPLDPSGAALARVTDTSHRDRFHALKDQAAAERNADPGLATAREILDAYRGAVIEVFEIDPILRDGPKGDLVTAKAWAAAGITATLCLDVFGPELKAKQQRDGKAPVTLSYLDGPIRAAHAAKGSPTVEEQAPPDPVQEERAKRYLAAVEVYKRAEANGVDLPFPDHAAFMRGDHDHQAWPKMPAKHAKVPA